jgi:hypothetical protein
MKLFLIGTGATAVAIAMNVLEKQMLLLLIYDVEGGKLVFF